MPPCAGLLGTAGILVSAAAAHLGGTSVATTGGLFLLLHAAAVLGLAPLAGHADGGRYVMAGLLLVVGAACFSGDLALAGLYGWRPLPLAAPIGGLLLIAGWLVIPLAALIDAVRGENGKT